MFGSQLSRGAARRAPLCFVLAALGAGLLAATLGCAAETVAPPLHLRAVAQPPPEPLVPLLSQYGMARLRLAWDPSPTLAAGAAGRYVVVQVSGARLDVRRPVAEVPATQTTVVLPVTIPPDEPPPLYEVVAEGPRGGVSERSGSGLVTAPRFLAGLPALHAGPAPSCLPPVAIRALAPDGRGGLWVATDGGGVAFRPPDGPWRRTTSLDGLLDDRVRSLAVAPDGAAWLGFRRGLQRLDPEGGSLRTWIGAAGGVPGDVTGLAFDHAGALWLATGGALARMAPGMARPAVLAERAPEGAQGSGLFADLTSLAAHRAWQVHLERTPVGGSAVTHVAVAPDGAVWVAGTGFGVARQAPGGLTWRRIPLPAAAGAAAAPAEVRGVAPGVGLTGWVATSAGLLRLGEAGAWQPVPLALPGLTVDVTGLAALAPDRVLALLSGLPVSCSAAPLPVCAPLPGDLGGLTAGSAPGFTAIAVGAGGGDGGLWLGARDGAVEWRADPAGAGRTLTVDCPHAPPPGDLSAVAIAPDGALWALSPVAAARRARDGRWTVDRAGAAWPGWALTALTFDPFGNVYAAAGGGVAVRFVEPPLWTVVPTPESARAPVAVALTGGRRVWTGGPDGLYRFDLAGSGRAERVPLTAGGGPAGAPGGDLAVTALAARPDGGLWIGTRAGLHRWTPAHGVEGPAAFQGPADPIDALATDGAAGLWLAGPTGVQRRSALLGGVTRYPLPESWADDPVVAIASRGDGVALATRRGRVGCADNAGGPVRERLDLTRTSASVTVRGLALDAAGTASLATEGLGLVTVPALCP
jgi:ligand-binding sensor domain-containing protein